MDAGAMTSAECPDCGDPILLHPGPAGLGFVALDPNPLGAGWRIDRKESRWAVVYRAHVDVCRVARSTRIIRGLEKL